jgi:hypothetical protein
VRTILNVEVKKRYSCPCQRHECIWAQLQSFLISAVDGGEWPASRLGCFNPGEGTLVPTQHLDGWAPEPVCIFSRHEKSLSIPRTQNPDRPAPNVVSILTRLGARSRDDVVSILTTSYRLLGKIKVDG